jgi:hypothetical protein
MKISDADIQGMRAFTIALFPSTLLGIAAGGVTALGTRRGLNSALNQGWGRLGLNLGYNLGRILRQGRNGGRRLKGWDLHNLSGLVVPTINLLLHARNEEKVNHFRVNWILNKSPQISIFQGLTGQGVRP